MDCKILIATSNRLLGEQISQLLQEAGYTALLTSSAAEAAYIMHYETCPIAILDCGLPDPGPAYLTNELRGLHADIRIIFIQSEDGKCEQAYIRALEDIYLPSPFYLSDLLEVINFWTAGRKSAQDEIQEPDLQSMPSELAWLKDVNRAAQYLTRLSLEIDAQAALIIQHGHIWAYAGELSQNAVEELTKYVGHHWANGNGSDLARFVTLETTGNEYMLYVTNLGSGFVLALSFETEMPFSIIRSQTGELARKLTTPFLGPPSMIDNSLGSETSNQRFDKGNPDKIEGIPEAEQVYEEFSERSWPIDDSLSKNHQTAFDEVLASLDIPDPEGSYEYQKDHAVQTSDRPKDVPPFKMGRSPKTQNETPIVIETLSTQNTDRQTPSSVELKYGSPALHDLAFSCLLIPRMPDHFLIGDLADLLNVDMPKLCLAFGWRLDHLAVRPQYLHWVVTVTPEVSASRVIQQIREQTSDIIFDEFPRLLKANPSRDYWAPGFMVFHGRRSLTGSLVDLFIQQTRTRQGIKRKSKRVNHA